MAKSRKGQAKECPSCSKKTGAAGHLCVPSALPHTKCDWCGAFIPNARHLCGDKIRKLSYICNSCGRTAVKAEYLCKPKKVR